MPNSMQQYSQGYMGPPLLDMTFEECAKVLRRMELLTYHSVVMTLRAQGSLTPQRHKLLKDLAALLEIPIERHKAEVRQAVNHEELCTIAFHMEGPNTGLGWQIEGARQVPLPPRPPPLTKYKLIADRAAEMAMKINAQRSNATVLPHPTLRREHLKKCRCDEAKASQEESSSKTVLHDNTESEKSESSIPGDETGLSSTHQPSSPIVVNLDKIEQDIIIEEKVIENEAVKLMPPPPAPPPPPPPPPTPPSPAAAVSSSLTPTSSSSTSLPQTTVPVQTTICTAVCTQTLTPTATVATSTLGTSSASLLSTSSTLMLPSGMSIQLREDDTEKAKKRKRSVSQDLHSTSDVNLPQKRLATKAVTKISGPVSVAQGSSRTVTFQAPIKISLNTPVINRNNLTSTVAPSAAATQKVIIVSNSSAVTTPSILHKSLSVPVIRATHPRLQKPSLPGGIMTTPVGTGKIRPKMVTIPAKCRPRANSIVIPVSAAAQNIQLKTALTLKQESLTVVDHNMKRVPIPGVPGATKILPKPSTMFVVNPTTGGVNLPCKGTLPSTSRLMPVHNSATQEVTTSACTESTVTTVNSIRSDSTVVTKPPPKSNVVILQKTPTATQGLTLTAANKEMIGKVLSGKNIITQTGRPVVSIPKNFIQKTLVPSIPVTTAPAGSVIVLDLSQDNVSRNLNLTEILQASGIIPSVSTPPTVQTSTVIPTTIDTQQHQELEQQQQQHQQQLQEEENQQQQLQQEQDRCDVDCETETKLFISKSTDWLQVGTTNDNAKTFTVEEVNLPYNAEDGETVVTFEEAVELLNEDEPTEETHIETVETIETTEGSSEEEQIEVAVIEDLNDETQVFSVQAGDLGAGDIAFIADKDIDLNSESVTSQIVIETVTEDKEEDVSTQICEFLPHTDDSGHIEQTEIETIHLDVEEEVPNQTDIHSNL